MSSSTLSGNSTTGNRAGGGAILARQGTLNIIQSTLSGNYTAGINSEGGAISAHLGSLQVVNSTLSRNATTGVDSEGGAVFAVFGNLTVSQSTLSGNNVSNIGAFGGAIFTQQGVVLLSQSTITENQSTSSSGGGIYTLSSPITIQNSIVAGNGDNGTAPDIRKSTDIDDTLTVTRSLIGRNNGTGLAATSGSTADGNGNFIGGATALTAIQPLLAPLAVRGGPTLTHALLAGSLAIDSGSNALAVDVTNSNAVLTTDQRGSIFKRIINGAVDMGAYELFTGPLVVSTTIDEFDNDHSVGDLSLREAIVLANGSPVANTITFDARTNGSAFNLSLGQMTITDTVTITGNGPANTFIDAQQLSRFFDITSVTVDVTLNRLALRNGRTTGSNASLSDSTFSGGAVRSDSFGTLTVNQSTITGRSTTTMASGGAIFAGAGGDCQPEHTFRQLNGWQQCDGRSDLLCDSSRDGPAEFLVRKLDHRQLRTWRSHRDCCRRVISLTVRFPEIQQLSSADGGAIFSSGGAVTVSHYPQEILLPEQVLRAELCMLRPDNDQSEHADGEQAAQSAGGGIYSDSAPISILNSIIAGNSDDGTAPDVRKSPTDRIMASHSLIGNNTGSSLPATGNVTPGVNGNFIGEAGASAINPLLSPLQNNGGPTLTHALLTGSLAINRGSNASAVDVTNGTTSLTNDQRGAPFARIVNSTVDMGAWEGTFIVVSTTTDELDSDFSAGDLSLREAIMLSNTSGNPFEGFTFAASTNVTPFNLTLGQLTISANVTITGNGAANTIIDAQTNSRIFDIAATVTVTLNGLALRNGRTFGTNVPSTASTFSGGAIRSLGTLTINQCTLTGNSTSGFDAQGGAIYNSGQLFINQTTISANTTSGNGSHGGAIFSARGYVKLTDTTLSGNSVTGTAASGGAIYVLADGVTIDRSTISGNTASLGGGGIFFVGTNVINFNRLIVMQSTISGNSSFGTTAPGGGGGIYGQFGEVFLLQSTVTANVSNHPNGGGGIYLDSSPAIIRNSIIAGNIAAETGPDIRESPDLVDKFAIHHSLVGRHNGLRASLGQVPDINGNYIGGDTPETAINPLLAPLANNGGRTQTHALQPGSSAIDHGLNSWAGDPTQSGSVPFTSDQRGQPFTRILDSDGKGAAVVDIGAFESTGVRLLAPNSNSFTSRPTLQWSPVAGAVSYNIHVNNQSTGVAPYYTSTATGTSHTVNADFGIGEYRVWIQPVFATGAGNWSAPREIYILTSAEWQPMARVRLVSRPTFSWKTLPGAVKYELWIDNFSTGQQQIVRQDVTGTSYTPAANLPMGLYRAWVRGIDAAGIHAAWSVLQEALVVPSLTPIGPLSGTFDRTPTFSWNPVTGAASYELYVRSQTTGAMVVNGQSVTATNFTPASNLIDGPYRWWTLALSPASIGPIKSGGSTTTDIYVGGRPTIIAPVAGSSTSDRTPTFSWRAVDEAASYQLTVNRIDIAQAGIISQTGITTASYTPATNLPAGTFRAWVRAVNSTGELSPWSIEVNFTVTATVPTIHSPETDLQLTGLLASALDRPGDRDTKWSRMLAVKHSQTAVTAHALDFEEAIAVQIPPSTKLVRPDTHVQKLNILDVDRLMEEFALLEFKTTAITWRSRS
ncbi:MAG: right-handed parallel beta-helix repeat-containing protein [Planctomycetaceae bacterium]